ncbi:uncharacterized protein LOC101448343 [Ceratitis capitata]|uniref:(Mediterranean fruit fly) hypothetical protein n=1 Tax=Ceratitis capitata TaxID=7213 RepID=W8C5R6_CERCA|nr:uncharacterized protein LOC101448343 [Ceratitis capitata]CAD7003481.1 unnamed protein product [Ceratitis capitata]
MQKLKKSVTNVRKFVIIVGGDSQIANNLIILLILWDYLFVTSRMSFFRNFRTKTGSKSKSRDSKPINMGTSLKSETSHSTTLTSIECPTRRDLIDSRTEALLNRSDTFILNSDQEDKESKQNSSNSSTLEKKSKKSKVLSKFATFTKRKKSPAFNKSDPLEHHPSDSATNTYYKWKSDGPTSAHTLDYDSQSDPFHFLYEQHSSLKDMQQSSSSGSMHSSHSSNSSTHNQTFDSSTYRKGKIPMQLKEQLSHLKTQTKSDLHEDEELAAEQKSAAEKYKTVTLNSFRKSFRDKFLLNQQNPSHNPAWFVVVESPKVETCERYESKENRPDFLVFENENYRPNSRSPIRDNIIHPARSKSHSPIKRNETFRMERPSEVAKGYLKKVNGSQTSEIPSISIEIKNSLTPHIPTRVVPVGVAKPMPSIYNIQDSCSNNAERASACPTLNAMHPSVRPNKLKGRDKSPLQNWVKPVTVTSERYSSSANGGATTRGRYQTLVHIGNESNAKTIPTSMQRSSQSSSRLSARIRLDQPADSPTLEKRLYTPGARYSLATPSQMQALSSYEPFENSTTMTIKSSKDQVPALQKLQQPRHTYFGDTTLRSVNGNSGNSKHVSTTTLLAGRTPSHINTKGLSSSKAVGRLQQPQILRAAGSGVNNHSRSQQQQHRQSVVMPMHRRSCSPIKIPWR